MNTSVICEFGGHLDSDETNPRGVLRSSPGPTRLFPVGRDAPEQCVFLSLLFCWKLCSSGENNACFRGYISQRVGKAGCGRQTPDGAATGKRRRGKEGKVRAKPLPLWALCWQGNRGSSRLQRGAGPSAEGPSSPRPLLPGPLLLAPRLSLCHAKGAARCRGQGQVPGRKSQHHRLLATRPRATWLISLASVSPSPKCGS